ncbi:sensor histidine kinase [Daejeonia sp. YH14]|uniref:sensor histidine kinase n=1 Tax=Daejeonia sp. YH14 TaxID=3439042 RepID=UPI003F49911E
MKKEWRFLYIAYCFLSILFCLMGFDAFYHQKYFTAFAFFSVAVAGLGYCWNLISKKIRETEKIINSIQQKDFSLYPKTIPGEDLKNSAVKLYYQSKEEHSQLYSYKNLYDTILNKLEIGFLILNKKSNETEWKVFYCNPSFLEILKVPKYNLWSFYQEKIPQFFHLIEQTEYQDSQDFIDISIQQHARNSYSIRTSRMTTYNNDFCIISLESIQKIIDQKEKQAWNNLMKVISHELLNTLTPINSLIYNLEYLTSQEELTTEDQSEIRDSLKVINSKSQQLLHFIDSYRQIAELPKPKKSRINLKDSVEKVVKMFEPELKSRDIRLQMAIYDLFVNADEKMMERVLVNLVTNAIFAVENMAERNISVCFTDQSGRCMIQVEDSGKGISPEISDKVFLPFFTTRQNGSGIGLTLARSIMEAHNGYLTFKNKEHGIIFEIWMM